MEIQNEMETEEAVPTEHGEMNLNIDAWKEKGEAYSSVLDIYGVPDLFSEERMEQYQKLQDEEKQQQEELIDYLFSGVRKPEEDSSTMVVEAIFSQELEFARNKNYTSGKKRNTAFSIFFTGMIALLFLLIILRYQMHRKAKRKKYVNEIDMEIK